MLVAMPSLRLRRRSTSITNDGARGNRPQSATFVAAPRLQLRRASSATVKRRSFSVGDLGSLSIQGIRPPSLIEIMQISDDPFGAGYANPSSPSIPPICVPRVVGEGSSPSLSTSQSCRVLSSRALQSPHRMDLRAGASPDLTTSAASMAGPGKSWRSLQFLVRKSQGEAAKSTERRLNRQKSTTDWMRKRQSRFAINGAPVSSSRRPVRATIPPFTPFVNEFIVHKAPFIPTFTRIKCITRQASLPEGGLIRVCVSGGACFPGNNVNRAPS